MTSVDPESDLAFVSRADELGAQALSVADRERLVRVLVASDFAFDVLRRYPGALDALIAQGCIDPFAEPITDAAGLRRARQLGSLAIVWRDVLGLADTRESLIAQSRLAEQCIERALEIAEAEMVERHGWPLDSSGRAQRMVVLGLGKLGGGELNFSSDVDLIFAYAEAGESAGPRSIANERWFERCGQRLIQLLDEVQDGGFCLRVDMRLRPFGTAGRLALSFAAMEQYYQREGRDWERYAFIKARAVAGDLDAGASLLAMLRPFVFRRYLDFAAFEGLREMKGRIDHEVRRKGMESHIKLGPGGIREIEFIVQLEQLIRGGRETAMRERSLLATLDTIQAQGIKPAADCDALRRAYLFLRGLENRLQMLRDQQTHDLPDDEMLRARIAAGLGISDWPALQRELEAHRAEVSGQFARLFARPERKNHGSSDENWSGLWQSLSDGEFDASDLEACGMEATAEAADALRQLVGSLSTRELSVRARERLDRLMPLALAECARHPGSGRVLARLARLLTSIGRRSSYLALLDEHPAALARVIDLIGRSQWLADRLIQHPLLLDQVLDARVYESAPDHAGFADLLSRRLRGADAEDLERELDVLREEQQGAIFRVAVARLLGTLDPDATARALAGVADVIITGIVALALRELVAQHGLPSGANAHANFAVLGYGSLGACELNFNSDLDLVFVYAEVDPLGSTSGPRVIDNARFYARLAQKIMHLLGLQTSAGRLYEVDVRLRPNGSAGLLVTRLDGFAHYQHDQAWTWEHQALVRARAVAGDPGVCSAFEAIRSGVLRRVRDPVEVVQAVQDMRERLRGELDRSREGLYDLKQGQGGLADIEFLLQAAVLMHAAQLPSQPIPTTTSELLRLAADQGWIESGRVEALVERRLRLLQAAQDCTLDARPRVAQGAQWSCPMPFREILIND